MGGSGEWNAQLVVFCIWTFLEFYMANLMKFDLIMRGVVFMGEGGGNCVASYMPSPAFLPCSIPQKIADDSVYNLRSPRSSLSDFKLNK